MSAKHIQILETVRSEIVEGRYGPGAMLPTRAHYEDRFDATAPTVQKAFDRLREDGFIEIRHRVGTFVGRRPPHLHQVALVFPWSRKAVGKWSRFHEALLRESAAVGERLGRTFVYHEGIASDPPGACLDALVADLRAHRVMGVIQASKHVPFDQPGMQVRGIPQVAVADEGEVPDFCGALMLDYTSILRRGAEYLLTKGCKRVAVLEDAEGLGGRELSPERVAILERQGLQLAPNGYVAIPARWSDAARHWVRLLVAQPPETRPQGLFVMDDTLVAPVVEGLAASGLRNPQDFQVVCHNNYPMPLSDKWPLHVLGFHAGHILSSAIEYLDRRRQQSDGARCIHFDAMTWEETAALTGQW